MKSILIEPANEQEFEKVQAFIKEHKMKGFIVEDNKAEKTDYLNDIIRILIPVAL